MIENLFTSTSIPVAEQVAHFAQARHQVLAGNLANIDTPGYRTRDLSVTQFQQRLKQAIVEQQQSPQPESESSRTHASSRPMEKVKEGIGTILHHDDSNVGVEHQVTEIAKNQMQHNLAMTIMGNQFRLLQAAISERA
ncbi:MAG: flagellar basal body rod protein FlgB [Planctomycetaceae bacterium]|nr:flagellar basal body rod protein FlgB [Planctomycetaceae bacterium]